MSDISIDIKVKSLLDKYVEEGDMAKCEALYMIARDVHRDYIKIALNIRYGEGSLDAISAVVNDISGISRIDVALDTISSIFNRRCLPSILKTAEERIRNLASHAKKATYLIIKHYEQELARLSRLKEIRIDWLRDVYSVIFVMLGRESAVSMERMLKDLIWSYIVEYTDSINLYLPPYFDELLSIAQKYVPERIEVRVVWPGES